jgi:hypothetical protein
MEEFHTYIKERYDHFHSSCIEQLENPDDFFDDKDVAHWTNMANQYKSILDYIESKYTTERGILLDEYLDYI